MSPLHLVILLLPTTFLSYSTAFPLLRAFFYLDSLASPEMGVFPMFSFFALLTLPAARSLNVQLFNRSEFWELVQGR